MAKWHLNHQVSGAIVSPSGSPSPWGRTESFVFSIFNAFFSLNTSVLRFFSVEMFKEFLFIYHPSVPYLVMFLLRDWSWSYSGSENFVFTGLLYRARCGGGVGRTWESSTVSEYTTLLVPRCAHQPRKVKKQFFGIIRICSVSCVLCNCFSFKSNVSIVG